MNANAERQDLEARGLAVRRILTEAIVDNVDVKVDVTDLEETWRLPKGDLYTPVRMRLLELCEHEMEEFPVCGEAPSVGWIAGRMMSMLIRYTTPETRKDAQDQICNFLSTVTGTDLSEVQTRAKVYFQLALMGYAQPQEPQAELPTEAFDIPFMED